MKLKKKKTFGNPELTINILSKMTSKIMCKTSCTFMYNLNLRTFNLSEYNW